MPQVIEKRCRICGIDVSQRKRTKDASGNYYCAECYEAAKSPQTEPDAIDVDGIVPSPGPSVDRPRQISQKSSSGFALLPSETILKEGNCNYEKGWELVGGKRFILTTYRLFFESHKINVQAGGLVIDLREIESIEPAWTKFLGLIPFAPTCIEVRMTDGQVHRFVLPWRAAWISAIRDQANAVSRR